MSHVLPVTSGDAVGTDGTEHVGNRINNSKYMRLRTFSHTYSGFKNVFVVSTWLLGKIIFRFQEHVCLFNGSTFHQPIINRGRCEGLRMKMTLLRLPHIVWAHMWFYLLVYKNTTYSLFLTTSTWGDAPIWRRRGSCIFFKWAARCSCWCPMPPKRWNIYRESNFSPFTSDAQTKITCNLPSSKLT